MVLLLSLVLWFSDEGQLIRPELKVESLTFEYLQPIGPWALNVMGEIIPWFKGMFEGINNQLDKLVNEVS